MEPLETLESPGKYLKVKRESQRLSLKEVADATRIREAVLRDFEEDRYMNLPNIYVKSFISAYAKCLGLNSNEVIMLHEKYVERLSFSKDRVPKQPSTIFPFNPFPKFLQPKMTQSQINFSWRVRHSCLPQAGMEHCLTIFPNLYLSFLSFGYWIIRIYLELGIWDLRFLFFFFGVTSPA